MNSAAKQMISFDQARDSAQQSAMHDLRGLYSGDPKDILEEYFLEGEHCWMFFHRRSIQIPPERSLSAFAYVIGKRSGGRCVADYWDDPPKAQAYLKVLSDYLATHDT